MDSWPRYRLTREPWCSHPGWALGTKAQLPAGLWILLGEQRVSCVCSPSSCTYQSCLQPHCLQNTLLPVVQNSDVRFQSLPTFPPSFPQLRSLTLRILPALLWLTFFPHFGALHIYPPSLAVSSPAPNPVPSNYCLQMLLSKECEVTDQTCGRLS